LRYPLGVGFILPPKLPTLDGTGVGSTNRISRCEGGEDGTCIEGRWRLDEGRGRVSKSSLASAIQSLKPSSFDTSFTKLPNVRLRLSGGVWIDIEDSERSEELDRFRRGSSQCLYVSCHPITRKGGMIYLQDRFSIRFPSFTISVAFVATTH
jgi:hypothetical protein